MDLRSGGSSGPGKTRSTSALFGPQIVERSSSQYRRRFLGVTIVVGLLLPFIIALESVATEEYWNLLPLALVESVLVVLYLVSRKASDRVTEWLITVLLAAYPPAYLWGVFSPGNHQVYVIVLLCMPPIFDTLAPGKWYWLWVSYAFTFVAGPWVSQFLGCGSSWTADFEPRMALILHVVFFVLWVLRFVTRRQLLSYAGELTEHIVKDQTTGLPSITVFPEAIKPGKRTCVAIITVGNFRELSTLFGYSIASEILASAADRLRMTADRTEGRAYRLRGHDFGYVRIMDSSEVMLDMVTTVSRGLSGPLLLREKQIELSYRIGYTVVTDGDAERSLDEAYEALGVAEREGLDIVEFDNSWGKASEAEIAIADLMTLSRNISEKSIGVFYQPVIALGSGKTAWNEALVRFKIREELYEEPSRFMALASSTGHWATIENFMLEKAVSRACSGQGPVSVNISLRDLDRPVFRDAIEIGAREARAKSSALIVEILEGDFGSPSPARMEILRELRKAGCLIAIDDFGTGYSNYSRLLTMPVDIVKFDQTLMTGAYRSKPEAHLLKGMVHFCFDIGALTVAEGVETQELADFASEIGFDFGQGYHWKRPVPEELAGRAERTPLLSGKMVDLGRSLDP